jgi:hypothetical protein
MTYIIVLKLPMLDSFWFLVLIKVTHARTQSLDSTVVSSKDHLEGLLLAVIASRGHHASSAWTGHSR